MIKEVNLIDFYRNENSRRIIEELVTKACKDMPQSISKCGVIAIGKLSNKVKFEKTLYFGVDIELVREDDDNIRGTIKHIFISDKEISQDAVKQYIDRIETSVTDENHNKDFIMP